VLLAAVHRNDESVAEARRALEVDRLSLPVNNIVGGMLSAAGRDDEAIEQYRKTLELDSNFAMAHTNLGAAYERKGLERQAVEEYLKAAALSGQTPAAVQERRRAYEKGGMRAFRRQELEWATAEWDGWHWAATDISRLQLRLGQRDEAMKWLEKAYEARSGSLVWIDMGDQWKELRSDPRFQDLLRRIGLPPAVRESESSPPPP
jgi:tetratricopeptide (TPR) repeat protein